MHRVTEEQTLLDTTLLKTSFNLRSDVEEATTVRDFEPKFFSIGFHGSSLAIALLTDRSEQMLVGVKTGVLI
jgi:hypothetical protein